MAVDNRSETARRVATGVVLWSIVIVVILIGTSGLFALGATGSGAAFLRLGGAAVALAFSAGILGAFLGLLFGLPREAEPADATSMRSAARFAFNTNLLKVSDWLTTVLVGLTLVSLAAIPDAVSRYSEWVRPALGDRSYSGGFGVFITLLALLAGFILAYIWTIISLRSHLEDAQRDHEQQLQIINTQVTQGRLARADLVRFFAGADPALLARAARDDPTTPPVVGEVAREVLDNPQ